MNSFCRKKVISFFVLLAFLSEYTDAQQLSPGVRVSHGAVNGVFIEKLGRKLVIYGDPEGETDKADMVLFTHFRRDVIWAGRKLVMNGSPAVAPLEERKYFAAGDSIFTEFAAGRFHDYKCQTTKIENIPVRISRYVTHGEVIRWQDTDIKVLSTPGYARGSVSYIVSSDRKKFAFVGDLIYGDGKIMDLYSLQDSLASIGGYHGYATRIGQLITSLQLILEQKPDFIVPSRGPVIEDPAASVQKLIGRLNLLYRNYLSISAYRWYFPERMTLMTNHIPGMEPLADQMPFSATIKKNPPSWYRHIINSNLVFADDSSAFLIDCGAKEALEEIVKLKQSGRLKRLDGVFITHYHDDHTDLINDVVREFNCPVYITSELKDILENPGAFHLPCLTEEPISNLSVVESGHSMKWKDFSLTFRFFPGQTLYHDALLFQKQNGEAIFFLGDSFTPSGIDDYCLLNRNLLHDGTGYLYCIDVLKKLPANVLLANQHVEPLFSFSSLQLELMKDLLHERNAIFRELFPWDDINYGVDEQWMSVYPYGQEAAPGQSVGCTVKIFNYSDVKKTFIIEPQKLKGFTAEPAVASLVIEPHTEGRQEFIINVSQNTNPGVSLQLFNVKFDDWDLREWSEALIEILP